MRDVTGGRWLSAGSLALSTVAWDYGQLQQMAFQQAHGPPGVLLLSAGSMACACEASVW